MLDIIQDQIARQDRFSTLVHLGHLRDNERLHGLVDDLVKRADRSMRDTAAPVGRSSGPIDIGEVELDAGITIDEPTAEVLRAKEELMVGDQRTFHVKFSAVDKSGKRCKVEILGDEGREIPCRITDPALMTTGNIYTHSLDTDAVAEIQAKPVLRDGIIRTLYISDGREPDPDAIRQTVPELAD